MVIVKLSGLPVAKTMSAEAKTHRAIERLLDSHVVSVVNEASKYCYKTCEGIIGTVDIAFINDRVKSGIF